MKCQLNALGAVLNNPLKHITVVPILSTSVIASIVKNVSLGK